MPLNKLYVHILREIMSCLVHYTFSQLVIVLASNVGSILKKLAYSLIIVNLPVLLTENGFGTVFLKNLLSYIIAIWEVCGVGRILSGLIRKAQPFKNRSSCYWHTDPKSIKMNVFGPQA